MRWHSICSIVCPTSGLEEEPSCCFRGRVLYCCCSASLAAIALQHVAMNKAKQQGNEDVCADELKPHHPVGLPICMCQCACQKHVRVCMSQACAGVPVKSMYGCASQKHVRVCVSEACAGVRVRSMCGCACQKHVQMCENATVQPGFQGHSMKTKTTCSWVHILHIQIVSTR